MQQPGWEVWCQEDHAIAESCAHMPYQLFWPAVLESVTYILESAFGGCCHHLQGRPDGGGMPLQRAGKADAYCLGTGLETDVDKSLMPIETKPVFHWR